jgi:hypothetical protein
MTRKRLTLSISPASLKRIEEILSKCRFYRDDTGLVLEEAIDHIYKSLLSKNFKR